MKPSLHTEPSLSIIYNGNLLDTPAPGYFDVEYWQSVNAVHGQAVGRGSAWFIGAPFGPVVLRRYFRGGWAAKLSHEHYFYTTVARSRPFREFNLLNELHQLNLPVPKPVAAYCEHHGIFSSGALITGRIDGAQTLIDWLAQASTNYEQWIKVWPAVGRCIKQFHDAGVWHADLNARNILLDRDFKVFLIDFDRARFTPGHPVSSKNNLARLKRSLVKLSSPSTAVELPAAWNHLTEAYHG